MLPAPASNIGTISGRRISSTDRGRGTRFATLIGMNHNVATRCFAVHEDPRSSEVTEEFKLLSEAIQFRAFVGAEIAENGTVFAYVVNRSWALTSAGKLQVALEAT
jgi:hypothetical protein